jgi:hypothetical protein
LGFLELWLFPVGDGIGNWRGVCGRQLCHR